VRKKFAELGALEDGLAHFATACTERCAAGPARDCVILEDCRPGTIAAADADPLLFIGSSPTYGEPRHGGRLMYFVAAVLLVLSGLFYAAGHHEIGSVGVEMCRYGSLFCDNPVYVLVGAILAALWGAFVSIR
jgi:hypothetical protein